MSDYIRVTTTIDVPRICKNCLYCGSDGMKCANANNHGRLMILINGGKACGWFWLNQHKYPDAERRC